MASEAEAAVNALKKLEVNKTCVNCGNHNRFGHQHVCEKVRTFVCSTCKSAHQSFSMRVKSVSMSHWTMDEVDALREQNGGGNAVAARVWYGRWDKSQMRKPSKEDALDYYKQCINRVYIDKAFYDEGGLSRVDSFTTSLGKSSGQSETSSPVMNLLDFDALAPKQASSGDFDAFGSSGNDEWGNFVAAPPPATSNDEFGAFVSAPALVSTFDDSNGVVDFSAAPAPAPASMDFLAAFASVPPAPTSTYFDPFANPVESVPASNDSLINGAAPSDLLAPGSKNQSQAPAANIMNTYNAAQAHKDFSVFDGLSAPALAHGTPHRNNVGQFPCSVGIKVNGHNQQLNLGIQQCGGLQKQEQCGSFQQQHGGSIQQKQQFYHVQPTMGNSNAGMNISTYFSPEASRATARHNDRDPFAGLGL